MSAISPGDWMEAIDDSEGLTKGSLYRVCEVVGADACGECGDEADGVELEGVKPHSIYAWCTSCEVRPIYRPKQEIIEALKAPPKRVKADA